MARHSDPLTTAVVLRAFSTLRQHLKQPEISDLDAYIRSYIDACPGASGAAFTAAVDHYLRTTERGFWPLPGTIAKLCREAEGAMRESDPPMEAYRAWSRDPWRPALGVTADCSAPCPICGATWVWQEWFRGDGSMTPAVLTIRHDRIRHQEAGIRYSDAPQMADWRPVPTRLKEAT